MFLSQIKAALTFSQQMHKSFTFSHNHSRLEGEEPTNKTQMGVTMSWIGGGRLQAICDGHCGYTIIWPCCVFGKLIPQLSCIS